MYVNGERVKKIILFFIMCISLFAIFVLFLINVLHVKIHFLKQKKNELGVKAK